LAAFTSAIRCDALPAAALDRARQIIADSLACGVAGFSVSEYLVTPLRRYALAIGGTPEATLIGGGERVAQPVAALANAATIHSIDFDDTHMPAIGHFGASVTAAALAAVERTGGSGGDLVAAVVAGFEAGGKVGRAVMPGHYQRWHSTASLGGIAAAAAAARAAGLDAHQTDMAISFAADDTGGTRYCIKVGDASKSLHAGSAAWKGSQGALLAELGAAGPTGLLEHPVGFFWSYSEEREPGRLGGELERLGVHWEILDDDIKAHPCILSSHTAVELALGILAEHGLEVRDVATVRLVQPPYSDRHGMNYEPDSAMAARLSIPYCVAVAMLDGRLGLEQFEGDRFADREVRELMSRIALVPNGELFERYPAGTPTVMVLETVAGDVHTRELGYPRGSHRRPMSSDEHRDKLLALLTRTLSDPVAERLMQTLASVDSLESVAPITDLLAVREVVA
jgi:2-methylcitrate dehydratase PrpD